MMFRKAVAVSITPLNISESIVTVASSWSCVWSWDIFASVLSRYFWFSSKAELSECSESFLTFSNRSELLRIAAAILDLFFNFIKRCSQHIFIFFVWIKFYAIKLSYSWFKYFSENTSHCSFVFPPLP